MYRLVFKRFIDLMLALIAFVALFPFFLIVFLWLAIANCGTPFFTQLRPGKNGKPFKVMKFKTMNDLRDSDGTLLPDNQRLTRIGRLLRKTSLDELPQFLNVIAGQMSLVGPRPLLMEYLQLYSPEQCRRHDVKPGLTGWAQVNGRNAISWQQKFVYDVWYVDNINFTLDLFIFSRTLVKVFKAEGISGKGVATAEKFTGNN